MILGFCGKKGSGKDTAAEVLLDKGWARVSFADPLKDICAAVFGLKPAKFHHPEFKDIEFTEPLVLNEEHADNLLTALSGVVYSHQHAALVKELVVDKQIKTARELLQFIGTDVIRNAYSKTYWVDLAESKLKDWTERGVNVVFTDVRFKDEMEMIKDNGGQVLQIKRNIDPVDNHSSEMIDFKVDSVIENNGAIHELHNTILENV